MIFNNTQRIAAQHAAPAVLGYKKTPSLFYIEKTSPARVTTSVRSCLAVRNLIGCDSSLTFQSFLWWSATVLIPFRCNRRSCCSLNSKWNLRFNMPYDLLTGINTDLDCTSPKPSSICACTSLSATEIWNFLRGILCNVVNKCTLLFVEFAYILRKLWFRFFQNSSIFVDVCKWENNRKIKPSYMSSQLDEYMPQATGLRIW